MLITDVASGNGLIPAGDWYVATDQVMGGVSEAGAVVEPVDGRPALHLMGVVSSENNGGFALLGCRFKDPFDAGLFAGFRIAVRGVGEGYMMSARTTELGRPWQSYRAPLLTDGTWQDLYIPFSAFEPNKTESQLNPTILTRLAVIATRKDAEADVALARLEFVEG